MASTINADNGVSSGSAGLKSSADSTGVLALQTNGTTAVTVDTSQNVGIGTTSPVTGNSKLTVTTGITAQDGTTPALQLYNTGAGVDQKYLRAVSTSTGTFNFEKVNDAYSAATGLFGVTSAGLFQFNSGYGSVATAYGCRAWANFVGNGANGNQTINASANFTSITKNGTGDYSPNLTNSMPDANYSAFVFGGTDSGSTGNGLYAVKLVSIISSSFRFRVGRPDTGALADYQTGMIAIFR